MWSLLQDLIDKIHYELQYIPMSMFISSDIITCLFKMHICLCNYFVYGVNCMFSYVGIVNVFSPDTNPNACMRPVSFKTGASCNGRYKTGDMRFHLSNKGKGFKIGFKSPYCICKCDMLKLFWG